MELASDFNSLELAGKVAASPRDMHFSNAAQALDGYRRGQFEALAGNLARGYRTDDVWLAFDLHKTGYAGEFAVLEVGPAYLDEVAVYQAVMGGAPQRIGRVGDQVPKSEVTLLAVKPAITLRVGDSAGSTVLVHINTTSTQAAVMKLYRPGRFYTAAARSSLIMGTVFALVMLIMLIAGAFYVLTRRPIYLGMVAYVAVTTMVFFFFDGLAYVYIDWERLQTINILTGLFNSLSLAIGAVFINAAFHFRQISVQLDRLFRWWATFVGCGAVLGVVLPYPLVAAAVNFSAMPIIFASAFGMGVQMWRRHGDALLFGPLYLLYIGFGAYNVTAILGLSDMTDVSLYGWQIMGTVSFISLQVLMYRRAWRQELSHRLKRKRLVVMLRERNRQLEERVQMRTRELSGALQEVEQAVASQREMLSIASHEFRTPAAMIKASLDSLAYLKGTISADVAQRLDNIGKASARLNRLANSLLSFQRLQELALKPQKKMIDLGQRVADLAASYPAPLRPALAPPEHQCFVMADPVLLDIALYNLIDNANRHNDPLAGAVTVGVAWQDNSARVTVRDCGPGVAAADREKVFERYVSSKPGHGNGLGLAIVRSIARAHGGDAMVLDNVPYGAAFVMTLSAGA